MPELDGALLTLVVSYALGSIPFGLILARLAGLGDVRAIGSGSIGATNILRLGGWPLGAATLLLDSGKGAAAVAVTTMWAPELAGEAAVIVVAGHVWPVWLGFRGGKGVATAFGAFLVLSFEFSGAVLATWVAVALVFRYSSAAALVATAAAPLFATLMGEPRTALVVIVAAIIWFRHIENIRRLLRGEESHIGQRKG